MKNLSIAMALLALPLAAVCAEVAEPANLDKVPPNSKLGQMRQRMRAKVGDYVVKPDSQKGKLSVVNMQTAIATSNVSHTVARLASATKYKIEFLSMAPESAAQGDWDAVRAKVGADIAVVLVDDGKMPAMLVAPDERWAVVNGRKLGKGLKTDSAKAKFLPGRLQKQMLRAIAVMSGSCTKFTMSPAMVCDVTELDMAGDFLPIDTLQQVMKYMESAGMGKKVRVPYLKACQEGWAASPTNEIEKAIWDKVHAMPQKPMKIEFDPKKGR